MANTEPRSTVTKDRVISIRIPVAIDQKADRLASETTQKKSDILRLAISRGVDLLMEQLKSESAA